MFYNAFYNAFYGMLFLNGYGQNRIILIKSLILPKYIKRRSKG
jgi:hypothetical protein